MPRGMRPVASMSTMRGLDSVLANATAAVDTTPAVGTVWLVTNNILLPPPPELGANWLVTENIVTA